MPTEARLLDHVALRLFAPLQQALAERLVRIGVTANGLSGCGLGVGLAACVAVASDRLMLALAMMLASRLLDGLDGAVARLTAATDRGAFIDIVFDFVFYACFVLAFAWRDPVRDALPAAVLLAAFIGTGSSFLAFAVQATKRKLAHDRLPSKGFYFLGGLAEGTETIACFALMCLWPARFAWWAYGFAVLCFVTTITRVRWGWKTFQ